LIGKILWLYALFSRLRRLTEGIPLSGSSACREDRIETPSQWEKDISLTFLESGLFKASIAASCQRSVYNFHSTSGDDANMGDIEIQKAVNP
jgi:hypothetical protein